MIMGFQRHEVRNIRWKKGEGYSYEKWGGEIDIRRHYDEGEKEVQKHICKHFGCGKTLSPQEQLFGNKCIKHHCNCKKLIHIIDKHIQS
jgi:hypothetical protein